MYHKSKIIFALQHKLRRVLNRRVFWLLSWLILSSHAMAFDGFPGEAISGTGSITRTTVGATGEVDEPTIAAINPINSMWYSWTAVSAGQVVVQTCSATLTNFNTILSSFSGTTIDALTLISRSDNVGGCATSTGTGNGSRVTLYVEAGTTYRIQVDGAGAAVGQFLLTYTFTAASYTRTVTDAAATEGADTAAFNLRLRTRPTGTTVVTIGPSPTGQCTFSPATLTFTTANWNTYQLITATAVDDLAIEGVHACGNAPISATGSNYSSVTGTTPNLTVNDNDFPSLVLATTDATATEGGGTGAFTLRLSGRPSGTVTVAIGASPGGQCTFSRTSLTFTTTNWNTPRAVTVTAFNDLLVEGAHTCTTGIIIATGGGMTGATAPSPTFAITDNDTASIVVAKNANVASVANAGDSIVYSVSVRNTGSGAATALIVSDSLVPMICPTSGTNTIALLAPGATVICSASYLATQADFDSNGGGDGDIDNNVSVAGTSGGVAVSGSSQTSVLCLQNPSLVMVKSSVPIIGPLVAGQTIDYTYTVTNNGNITMSNISIDEISFNGTSPLAGAANESRTDNAPTGDSPDNIVNDGVWSTLGVGDVAVFQVSYTLTQVDFELLQ